MELFLSLAGAAALGALLASAAWAMLRAREQRAALVLQESDSRYRTLMESVPVGVVLHRGGPILFANRAAAQIAGVAGAEALAGRNIADFMVDDLDRQRIRQRFLDVERGGGEVPRAEFRLRPAAGAIVLVEAHSVRVALGGENAILTLWNDITARRQAEDALRESQLQLALAIAASGLALFDWYPESGEVQLSAEWARITGAPPAPVRTTALQLYERLHPAEAPALLERIRALLKGEIDFYDVEHRVRTEHGEWRWIASRAKVTARDAGGRATRVSGTNADVSYRKEVDRLKDEFIATVSHELRSPLASMRASLALLREGRGTLPEPARRSLDLAWQNGERLAGLVNDILDLERMDTGTLRLHMEPMQVTRFLRRALVLNAPAAERYRVHFELDACAEGLRVEADPDRLLQILTNLLSNAAKFSPDGEVVRVTAQAMGDAVRILVIDRGCGIEDAIRGEIFSRFIRGRDAEGPRRGGTGLGLAISKALVERMGGRIGFDSAPGRGSTFFVDLPAL